MPVARKAARAYAKKDDAAQRGARSKGGALSAARDEKLDRGIERSRPSDCRSAYAGLGILAVIPLVASALTGKGCKW